jgi:hypothetical protein
MTNAPDELPVSVRGVIAYLDVILADEVRLSLKEAEDNRTEAAPRTLWSDVPEKVRERIKNEFRLMYWGSPLREALARFSLFHHDDMADALMNAYRLHLQGRIPVDALRADYRLKDWGVLNWRSRQEVYEAYENQWLWSQFVRFCREGDRFVYYSGPLSSGTLLLRGDRLVWAVEELHMTISELPPRWRAMKAKFDSLGGTRGFLAGEFVWPPEGWSPPDHLTSQDSDL